MHAATRLLAAVAATLTALGIATTAHAQATGTAAAPATAPAGDYCGPGTADPKCENVPRVRSQLYNGIELTQAQQEAVDAITLRYRALHNQLQAQNLPVAAHNAQVQALRARDIAEKRKLMTPAQLPIFDVNADSLRKRDAESIEAARKRAAERDRQGGGTPPA